MRSSRRNSLGAAKDPGGSQFMPSQPEDKYESSIAAEGGEKININDKLFNHFNGHKYGTIHTRPNPPADNDPAASVPNKLPPLNLGRPRNFS